MATNSMSIKCAVEGCGCWAKRGQEYCGPHLRQHEENLELGLADATPRLVGRKRGKCRVRGCDINTMPNSPFCREHARLYAQAEETQELIGAQFTALLAQLDAAAPDCAGAVARELDMLASARRMLVAYAEVCSRSGWRGISPTGFMRLWLSSAATANDLIKSRYVIENASGGDIDRLLGSVYSRIEREGAAPQQPLPGMQPALPGFAQALQAPAQTPCVLPASLASAEEQLAEWLLEANGVLGRSTVMQIAQAYADEHAPRGRGILPRSPDARSLTSTGLAELITILPHSPACRGESTSALPRPSPAELAERMSTLAEIMERQPDLEAVRRLLAAGMEPPEGLEPSGGWRKDAEP